MIEKENQFSFAGDLKNASSEFLKRSGDAIWAVNDSSFDEYCGKIDFPGQGGLFEILERQIGYDKNNAALDIAGGSQGAAVQDLLSTELVGKGLVTNFEDLRTEETKAIETLDHIVGDVADEKTWQSDSRVETRTCSRRFFCHSS